MLSGSIISIHDEKWLSQLKQSYDTVIFDIFRFISC